MHDFFQFTEYTFFSFLLASENKQAIHHYVKKKNWHTTYLGGQKSGNVNDSNKKKIIAGVDTVRKKNCPLIFFFLENWPNR